MDKFKIVFIAILICTSASLYSQAVIDVDSKIDTLTIKVGEEIKYEFSFTLDSIEKSEFKFSKINPPFEIIEEFELDTLIIKNKYRFTKRYSLTSFEPGSFSIINPLKIVDQIIKTGDSIIVNVSNVKVDTVSKKFFDIKNIISVDRNNEGWWKKYFLFFSIAIILFLISLLYKNSNFFKSSEEVITPPLEKAIKALKQLELKDLNNQLDYKLYYSKLTEIVKGYFEEEVKVDALESTTNELIEKLELLKDAGQLDISKETLNNFKSVLATADLVKFAKSNPGSETAILDKKVLETVLVDTKEAIPEPSEEELLKNEIYLKKIKEQKKKKLYLNIFKISSVLITLSLVISISIFGWQDVKDTIVGNETKNLLERKDWVESSYGAYPISITSPDVLKRNDSKLGQLFDFQTLEDSFFISVLTKPINEEEDHQAILIENLKSKGALNILTQEEEFSLNDGISTTKYFGSFDYNKIDGNSVKKEYYNLTFFENGGTQIITTIIDRDNKYASEIIKRIENSIYFKKD